MRILHVLAERGWSGGEVQLRYLLEHLQARGHDNHLILQPGAQFAAVAHELGIAVERVRMRNDADPIAWWRLRRAVRRARPELVHFACSRAHKLGAVATWGLPGPARVVTRRMDYPLKRGGWARWLYARAVDAAVVISNGVQVELERVGVPADRIRLIHEGVDAERLRSAIGRRREARREFGIPDPAVVVLCGGSLTRRKGQVHLIRAFATLAAEFPAAHLLLAGEGPERDALERAAIESGAGERIHLPGWVAPEDAFGVADIACMPSLREGLSVFCLEAAASGLPVVASRVGGLPEAVADRETGLLVEPGDSAGLAAALRRLLEDRSLRHRMGAAGASRIAERFSASEMASQTEAFYAELVERAGERAATG